MKKRITACVWLGIAATFILSGCLKDSCTNTYTLYMPVYKTLTEVRAGMKSGAPQPLKETGKLYVYGRYLLVNEVNKGIHVLDNSNPAAPKNMAFITIPGNVDLAVKDQYLYADAYADLVVFDMNDPANIRAKKFVPNVFPFRSNAGIYSTNPDSVKLIVDYLVKDTTVNCQTYRRWTACANCAFADTRGGIVLAAAPSGTGGSMARFALVNNYLYTVSNADLLSFNIDRPAEPNLTSKKQIGWNIETIYPFSDKLFIGSATGMFIYDMANAASPSLLSQFSHVRSCDPVIADDKYAYVTLRSGTRCNSAVNELQVLDIARITNPTLLKIYPMANPWGLTKDGNLLFICDGKKGLKMYDATDVNNVKLLKTIRGMQPFDAIAQNGLLIVVAKEGIYQYHYTSGNNLREISKIIRSN